MRKDLLILLAVFIPLSIVMLIMASNFSSPAPFATTSVNPPVSQNSTVISPAASRNIEVLSPRGGDFIKSGFAVKGNARVFESNVSIRLMDSQNNILIETNTTANAPDAGQFGSFEKIINFKITDDSGTLEIYQVSAKDGSEIDKVTIPVLFN